MATRPKKALTAFAALLAFSFSQVDVQAVLPNPATGSVVPQRLIAARLSTTANRSILVNGNSLATGATILTGATLETPDQVSATIDLGDAGVVELQPNSKIQLDFDENGNVRVKVIRGCAVTRKKTNVLPGEMELYTDQASEKTGKKRRHAAGCIYPNGQLGSLPGGIGAPTLAGLAIGGGTAGIIIAALTRGGTISGTTPGS